MNEVWNMLAISPITGDGFRPWIAAIVLIVSIIVLIGLFVFGRKDGDEKDKQEQVEFEEEDE